MQLEDKKIREDIICLQASLIHLKRHRQEKKRYHDELDKQALKKIVEKQNEIKQKQRQFELATEALEEIYIDGKPLTDLILDRQMEEDFEKELEELEKRERKRQKFQ